MRVLVCVCLLLTSVFTVAECDLTVRYERYSFQSNTSDLPKWHGLDVDFAKALLSTAGCTYHFVELPWARALGGLKAGLVDLVLSVSKTPEREPHYYFIGPQRNETIVIAMNNANIHTIEEMEDLLAFELPIAIHRGAYYGEQFTRLYTQYPDKFITVVDNQTKLDLLAHNKISGFLEEKGNLLFQKQHNPDFAHVYVDDFVINNEYVYYAFSKRSLNPVQFRALQNAFFSQEYLTKKQEILTKYGLE